MTVGRIASVVSVFGLALVASACRARDHAPPEGGPAVSAADDGSVPAEPPPLAQPPITASAQPVADWVWTPYRGDHFTAFFPGEPKARVLPAEDDKAGFSEISLVVPGGQVSFAVGFTEHSADEVRKPEFLDERASTPRRGFAVVLHKRAIALPGGQPGRVLIERRNISGTTLRVYSRLYLVGRRLYSLIVSTLDEGGVGEEVVKRFMDSFKLT